MNRIRNRDMEELNQLLLSLTEELKTENERENNLISQINNLKIETNVIEEQYKNNQQMKNKTEKNLRQLENSRSWIITSLMRRISNIIKNGNSNHGSAKKSITSPGEKKGKLVKIRELVDKLYILGFHEQAYNELYAMVNNDSLSKSLQSSAAWELALWHGNKLTENDAEKCIELINICLDLASNKKRQYHSYILTAECYKILKKDSQAKQEITAAMNFNRDANILLAASNFETSVVDRVKWINTALDLYNLPHISLKNNPGKTYYDCLKVDMASDFSIVNQALITVIMPTYNAEKVIETALESVLSQTWKNTEIIVVDDCSNDGTVRKIQGYIEQDARIKLIRLDKNQGTYIARNTALKIAKGEFVTCHDADDWSHPMRLELQALHLNKNPKCIANTTQASRITEDLMFYRKGRIGNNIITNTSSLMFRRTLILEKVGYWDSVRFSSDSEFINRIYKLFGKSSIEDLKVGPLSFPRVTNGSLTANSSFGLNGPLTGARRYYRDRYLMFQEDSNNLKYDFPQINRPFAIIEPMKPDRSINEFGKREFDIVFISDFRLNAAVSLILDDINLAVRYGYKVGIIQLYDYDKAPTTQLDNVIKNLIDNNDLELIVYGENIESKYLIIRYLPILNYVQNLMPKVISEEIHVIVDEPNNSIYNIKTWEENVMYYFGNSGEWHPVNQTVPEDSTLFDENWMGIETILKRN